MTSSTQNILPSLENTDAKKLENDLMFLLDNHNESKWRKAVLSDFLNNTDTSFYSNTLHPLQRDKLKQYRIQNEYGEKKFIKP